MLQQAVTNIWKQIFKKSQQRNIKTQQKQWRGVEKIQLEILKLRITVTEIKKKKQKQR